MKKIFYILTIMAFIVLSVFIFFIIKAHQMTFYSDFVLITLFDLIILAISGALNLFIYKDKNFLVWYSILFISLMVMLNYAPDPKFQEDLHFYYYLSLGAVIVILASLIGNVIKVEKKPEEGFEVYQSMQRLKNPLLLIVAWLGVFFLMGILVSASGHTFIGYPKFAVGSISGSLISGFAVGDWENIVLLIMPFAITFGLVYHFTKNKFLAVMLAILVSVIVFTTYHTVAYETDIPALLSVVIWSVIGISIYGLCGIAGVGLLGLVILSAMHIGNNFWGNLFDKSVYAFQSYSSNVKIAGIDFMFIELLIISILIYSLHKICYDGELQCSKRLQSI